MQEVLLIASKGVEKTTIICKIYLEFSRFDRKSWFEVKV